MSKVGIIVGSGTGRELANVFRQSLQMTAEILNKKIEIIECEREFNSYHQMLDWSPSRIEEAVQDDLTWLGQFYKDFYADGGRAIFRTAINAETLYRFRRVGKAVKTFYIPSLGKRLLFLRDEIQGYYANDSCQIDEQEVRFSGSFSRDEFQRLAAFSSLEGDRVLRKPYDTWVVYKHHLFANLIETWAKEFFQDAKVYQPNHATDLLFQYLKSAEGRDLLVLAGNEVGDILHEVLIFYLSMGTRNTLHSRNVYLHEDMYGLVEYQTVHGSADSLGGQGIVNPQATLRAMADLVEEQLEEPNFHSLMDAAIVEAEQSGTIIYDSDGQSSTSQMAEAILAQVERLHAKTNRAAQ